MIDAADNHLGEAMVAVVATLFAILAKINATSPDQFLNLPENFTRDNGFVANPGLRPGIANWAYLKFAQM